MDRVEELVAKYNKEGFKLNTIKLGSEWFSLHTARQRLTHKLYEEGYLKSLDTYKDIDLINILRREYTEESASIDCLYSGVTGELDINKSRLLLASFRCKNEELKKIYLDMIDVFNSEFLCDSFKKLGITDSESLKVYNPSLKLSDSGFSSPFKDYISGLILPYLDFGSSSVHYKSIRSVVYFDYLEYLGIKSDSVMECKSKNEGVLLKDLTYNQEVQISDILIDATVHIDRRSVSKDVYYKYVNYKKDFHKNISSKFFVLPKTRKNFKSELNELVDYMEDLTLDIIALSNDYIAYKPKGNLTEDAEEFLKEDTIIDNSIKRSWENGSIFCKMYSTGKLLSEIQFIRGMQGEYVDRLSLDALKNSYELEDSVIQSAQMMNLSFLKCSKKSVDVLKRNMYEISSVGLPSKFSNTKVLKDNNSSDYIFSKFGVSSIMELNRILTVELNTLYDKYLSGYTYMSFEEIKDVSTAVIRYYINCLSDKNIYTRYKFECDEQVCLKKFYSLEDVMCFVALFLHTIVEKYKI